METPLWFSLWKEQKDYFNTAYITSYYFIRPKVWRVRGHRGLLFLTDEAWRRRCASAVRPGVPPVKGRPGGLMLRHRSRWACVQNLNQSLVLCVAKKTLQCCEESVAQEPPDFLLLDFLLLDFLLGLRSSGHRGTTGAEPPEQNHRSRTTGAEPHLYFTHVRSQSSFDFNSGPKVSAAFCGY